MKRKIFPVVGALLMLTVELSGQSYFPEFDFSVVEDVDSIVINTEGDDYNREVMYYIDGRRTTTVSFDSGAISYYRTYAYNDKKGLRYEAYYGKVNIGVGNDGWIEYLDPYNPSLTVEKYSGGRLVEKHRGNIDDGDTTIHQVTTYTYDANQKLKNEVQRDMFVGWVGSFKSNSAELKEVHQKESVRIHSKVFTYQPKRIIVNYSIDNKPTGKEIIDLNEWNLPAAIKTYDLKNNLLSEETAQYDAEKRLKQRTWRSLSAISVWGGEADVTADCTITIEYDTLGRPVSEVIAYESWPQSKRIYRYY